MAWTDRQHAMLRALGLRAWSPPLGEGGDPDAGTPSLAVDAGVPATAAPMTSPPALAAQVASPPASAAPVTSSTAAASSTPGSQTLPRPAGATAAPAPSAAALRTGIAASGVTAAPLADWVALRAAVAACTACGLAATRTQTVFGVGQEQAHWMVVGEAPGEEEDLQGEPFVGAAGQLLDRMLAALQLTRSTEGDEPASRRVYIANTLKCRPPRNRNPTPQELAQCEPFLVRQIELLQPRLIVAMGAFAVRMLLRSEQPVGRLRGQVHRYHGVPLIVTYHPAYLLRSPLEKARAWEDLCLAAQVAEQAG